MEIARNNPFLPVTQQEMEKIRKLLDTNREKITIYLNEIGIWIKKEGHLAESFQYLDNNILENFYILEKGSVERTKLRIDRFLTTRGLVPELCLNKSIDEFHDLMRNIMLIPLPKLNPSDLSRLNIFRLNSEEANNFDLVTYCRYLLLYTFLPLNQLSSTPKHYNAIQYIAEFIQGFAIITALGKRLLDYKLKYDYCYGARYIMDLKHFNLNGLSKLNPFILKKAEVVYLEGYGFRVKGIHIINPPFFVDKFVAVLKKVIRAKVASRIYVHKNMEDLYKEIAKEVLPEEYGGNLMSCTDLFVQWKSSLESEEGRKFIENTNKLVSDDSKRSSYTFNAEYLGTPGSFRQLVVD